MGVKSASKSEQVHQEWLKWFSNPQGETQQQLSKRIGVSETTLIIWKKAHTQKNKTNEELGKETFDAMVRAAKAGNAAAGRTVMQALGMLIEKEEDKHPTDFTPEQYIEIAVRIINRLKQQYQSGGDCPVCNRPSLLHSEIRQDTGQDKTESSPILSIPISDRFTS